MKTAMPLTIAMILSLSTACSDSGSTVSSPEGHNSTSKTSSNLKSSNNTKQATPPSAGAAGNSGTGTATAATTTPAATTTTTAGSGATTGSAATTTPGVAATTTPGAGAAPAPITDPAVTANLLQSALQKSQSGNYMSLSLDEINAVQSAAAAGLVKLTPDQTQGLAYLKALRGGGGVATPPNIGSLSGIGTPVSVTPIMTTTTSSGMIDTTGP